jgi:hypothetical protein
MKRLLGDRHYMVLRHIYSTLRKDAALWSDPRWRKSFEKLLKYKDKHCGERCFIIGNGPSLKRTNLSHLKNEVTIGLNRIYLLFDELGFSTSYYVSVNKLVIKQFASDIEALPMAKFINWSARDTIEYTSNMIFLHSRPGPAFYQNLVEGVWEGATVTYVAMQIAYYLGFDTVVLIGVDHSFATKGKPHSTVTSQGDDPNHFDDRYFGKGVTWQLPDLEMSEVAYRIAKYQFESKGRKIIDATVGGKLDVFPKVQYERLF